MISIIIPCYNGGKHIEQCYASLCAQSHTDWHAVFIDDGSKDNSGELLDRLAARDNRVQVIHKPNEGVAVARECGIKAAEDEYITFLDIDDNLTPDALGKFLDAFSTREIDMVCAGINMIGESGEMSGRIRYKPDTLTGTEAFSQMCRGKLRWQLCGKAYRRHLLDNVETPRGIRSGEDMAVCMQAALNAHKVEVISECLYNYIQVASSVTHAAARTVAEDAIKAACFVEKCVSAHPDSLVNAHLDSMFMLMVSGALRANLDSDNTFLKDALKRHYSLHALTTISPHKALSIMLFRIFGLNLAKYL